MALVGMDFQNYEDSYQVMWKYLFFPLIYNCFHIENFSKFLHKLLWLVITIQLNIISILRYIQILDFFIL